MNGCSWQCSAKLQIRYLLLNARAYIAKNMNRDVTQDFSKRSYAFLLMGRLWLLVKYKNTPGIPGKMSYKRSPVSSDVGMESSCAQRG